MTLILDGKATAKALRQEIAGRVAIFRQKSGIQPCLAAVLVGDDPASQVYVRNKERACHEVGMVSRLIRMPVTTTQDELLQQITGLNQDAAVSGILVQLPLPAGLDSQRILDSILPLKDVDAFHPENVGLLVQDRPRFLPCTPHGVLQILKAYDISTQGKHVVVIGRSEIVGKPMAMLLVQKNGPLGAKYANATVTIGHSRSQELAQHIRQADIVVAAVGQPKMITGDMIKPGAVVIDVGINRIQTGLVGDVDYESAFPIASAITPVPGGIGPLTVAMLLDNTLKAAILQSNTTPVVD